MRPQTPSLIRRSRKTTRILSNRFPAKTFISTKGPPNPKLLVETVRQRFQNHPDDPQEAWDSLWRDGTTPWDIGRPTDALISELRERALRPRMTLIPGCGSAHDLVSLGRYLEGSDHKNGYHTVVGLELSRTSLIKARGIIEDSLRHKGRFEDTAINLYEGDFFACPSSWTLVFSTDSSVSEVSNLQLERIASRQKFDFIFDYTFFCAIPPHFRSKWGQQMANLLAQDGKLFTLIFPYHTSRTRVAAASFCGPPYLVSLESYEDALNDHDLMLETKLPYGRAVSVKQRQGQEMIGWWSKAKL